MGIMKNYIKYILLLLVFTSCEDVLDKRELDAVDNEDVWNTPALANLYLNRLYTFGIPGFGGNANTNISDESYGSGTGNMMYGMLQFTDGYGNFGVSIYSNIRQINILLDQIEQGSLSEEEKNEIKGQALFLRAWIYWEMVKLYGGVPMIMEPQDPNLGDDLFAERDPASRCIELIIQDLDEAIGMLPSSWPAGQYGRITRAAAAALKGRVLLFYASPQFNPGESAERWTQAYEANKQAKAIAEGDGYGLYSNFENVFLDEGNQEAIFVTVYDGSLKFHGYENSVRPASVSNSGATSGNPTWEFVEAFPMADGRPIEGHPDYDPEVYWQNRDPRFYATVAYNSAEWIFEERESARQWTYNFNDQEGVNNTRTGFYVRKNVDESIPLTETNRIPTDWIEIRFAEVMLNLAESANEAGHTSEAYTELKAIRERAGIEPGADDNYGLQPGMSTEEMREAIMLERQIELAYEDKRHWDLRRRNLYEKELNGTRRTGIQTELNTEYIASLEAIPDDSATWYFENVMRDTIDWGNNYTLYFDTDFDINLDEMDINYLQPKYNFYFLPQSALEKDPKLEQTVNWEGGTFDPLAPN